MTTKFESIVDMAADTIVDIASDGEPLDFEPFTDNQYERIKAVIKTAVQDSIAEVMAEAEAWAE